MKSKDKIREELKQLSPFLSGMKNGKEAFKVPKDYFKTLPDEVLKQLSVPESKKVAGRQAVSWLEQLAGSIQWLLQPRHALAFATVSILLIAGIYFTISGGKTADKPFAELTAAEVSDYIAANIDDFDLELLIAASSSEQNLGLFPESAIDEKELDMLIDDILDDIDIEDLEELL